MNLHIWMGLFLTQSLYYRQTCLNGKYGYITEVAELKTGDFLLRVPHKYNFFLYNDKISCQKYIPMWIPKEDCMYNTTNNHLTLKRKLSYKNNLNSDMLQFILRRNASSNTPLHILKYYDDELFMQSLFYMFQDNPMGLKKYIQLGPTKLPITIRQPISNKNTSIHRMTRITELM